MVYLFGKRCRMSNSLYILLTERCNIDCSYCYIDKSIRTICSADNYDNVIPFVDKLIEKIKSENIEIKNIIFHGGETTVIPADILNTIIKMFQEICELVILQTNGINMGDKEYITILLNGINLNKFQASVSIDGPADIHNYNRNNSHKQVNRGIINLFKYYKTVYTIGVISKHTMQNLDLLKEWLDVITVHGIEIKLTIGLGAPYGLDEEDIKIFRKWILYNNYTDLFEDTVGNNNGCTVLTINTNGDVSSCVEFVGTSLVFANVFKDSFKAIIHSRSKAHTTMMLQEDSCKGCEFYSQCKHGCPSVKYYNMKNNNKCFIHKEA